MSDAEPSKRFHVNIKHVILVFGIIGIIILCSYAATNSHQENICECDLSFIQINDTNNTVDTNKENGILIPKNIYITHKYNLCNNTINSDLQEAFRQNDIYYFYLLENVEKIKQYNPSYNVICFDDEMAYNYIKRKNSKFAKYFLEEKRGMYKSDIFRIVLLYHEGGYYFDSDMEPRMSLNKIIYNNSVTFTSAIALSGDSIFQSYLGTTKYNPILKINLQFLEYFYSQNIALPGNMGTVLLGCSLRLFTKTQSLFDIQDEKNYSGQIIQLLTEKTFSGQNAEEILLQRKDVSNHPKMVIYSLYDRDTNLWPFWSRFSQYENMNFRHRPPSNFSHNHVHHLSMRLLMIIGTLAIIWYILMKSKFMRTLWMDLTTNIRMVKWKEIQNIIVLVIIFGTSFQSHGGLALLLRYNRLDNVLLTSSISSVKARNNNINITQLIVGVTDGNDLSIIPKNIYIKHKYNLCDHKMESFLLHKISKEVDNNNYIYLLQNVLKIKQFYPEYNVICFDDVMAYNYIASKDKKYAKYFIEEQRNNNMNTSNIFSIMILYYEGGYYFDNNLEPRIAFNPLKSTTFISTMDDTKSNLILNSYIGSTQNNDILNITLKLIDEYYTNGNCTEYEVSLLTKALKLYTNQSSLSEIQNNRMYLTQKIQLLQEINSNQSINMKQKHIYDVNTNRYPFWNRFVDHHSIQ